VTTIYVTGVEDPKKRAHAIVALRRAGQFVGRTYSFPQARYAIDGVLDGKRHVLVKVQDATAAEDTLTQVFRALDEGGVTWDWDSDAPDEERPSPEEVFAGEPEAAPRPGRRSLLEAAVEDVTEGVTPPEFTFDTTDPDDEPEDDEPEEPEPSFRAAQAALILTTLTKGNVQYAYQAAGSLGLVLDDEDEFWGGEVAAVFAQTYQLISAADLPPEVLEAIQRGG